MNIKIEKAYASELQRSDSLKLIFLLEGELQLQLMAQSFRLKANDFIFIKPYEAYAALSEGSYSAYELSLDPEELRYICPEFMDIQFPLRLIKAHGELADYNCLATALAWTEYYRNRKDSAAAVQTMKYVCEILQILIVHLSEDYGESSTDQDRRQYERIQDILRYIARHYREKILLEDIAGAIGFNPQYFSSYFSRLFKMNFSEYLNDFRISRSLTSVENSDDTFLAIAVENGFNNHKTFEQAFKKKMGCTPREYRKAAREGRRDREDPEAVSPDIFNGLRRFRNEESKALRKSQNSKKFISIDLRAAAAQGLPPENKSCNIISVGRAISLLRSDLQQQIKKAAADMKPDYVRVRDIFSDDLFVYYEDKAKNPVFSWKGLDEVFDFILSVGARPYPEIGYMPGQLASKKQYAGWQYHPNVSYPKSAERWQLLIKSFMEHLIQRYGVKEVRQWMFGFWTAPNLRLLNGYWNESMEMFFDFYRLTYDAVKKTDSAIRLGTPNFSWPSGREWYDSFLEMAGQFSVKADFLAVHLYGCADGQDSQGREFLKFSAGSGNTNLPPIVPERDFISRALDELRAILDKHGSSDLKIVVDDWNVSFFPTDYTRDTSFMGPYILENYFGVYDRVMGMGFASLSDIHEDFFNTDLQFHGGPGLMDYYGIPKAGYYAMQMAFNFNRRLMARGENYVAAAIDGGFEILLFNMDFYEENYHGADTSALSYSQRYNVFKEAGSLYFHIEIPAKAGCYEIRRNCINREHGSSYDDWLRMGSPAALTVDMVEYLKNISRPAFYCGEIETADILKIEEEVPPHGITYIRLVKRLSR